MQKTAIVTGAARGIGKAIAKRLVEDGFFVVAVYNSSEKLAKELESELYPNVKAYKCDVSDAESVNAVVKAVLKDRKTVDVLVNNAGIAQQKLFTDITDEDWSRMIGVDLSGAFYFTRAILPSMINEKLGRIINITSMWGETGGSCEVHYSAAKAGLIGMTKALAKETGLSGVCVNAVSPGVIETDMMSGFSEADKEALREEIPLSRLGRAEDVANAVAFLCSEKASYITGQVISVNGGIVI